MIRRHIWEILSAVCFIVAIGLLGVEPLKTHLIDSYQPKITRSVINQSQNKPKNYNFSSVHPVNMRDAIKARANSKNVSVAGQMLVPSEGIHIPIDEGVGWNSLLLGAGTMRPRMKMGQGNYALAGHHMKNKAVLFTPLWYHAHIGTFVYLTDMKNVYVYKINVRKIISPYDVGVANNTAQAKLTLITCNDSGSKRLLLQGKLIKKGRLKSEPRQLQSDINSRTNNHDVLKGY